MHLIDYSSQFQIPRYLFLRKCAAIKEQLRLMGYPNSKLQIRNIPIGSENYYACFTECCYAIGYKVQKNGRGEVIDVIAFTKLKIEQEVEDYKESQIKKDNLAFEEHIYPIADPNNLEIYVYDDEKIDFIETTDYTLKKIQAAQAIEEIENESKQIFVTKSQISTWLKKHHDFYWSLQNDWNVLAFRPFQLIYFYFQFFADDFQHMVKARQAVEEYQPFDEDWLYKYDRLYFCALMGWEYGYEIFHDEPFILKKEFSNLHMLGEEFRYLYEFPRLFLQEQSRHE